MIRQKSVKKENCHVSVKTRKSDPDAKCTRYLKGGTMKKLFIMSVIIGVFSQTAFAAKYLVKYRGSTNSQKASTELIHMGARISDHVPELNMVVAEIGDQAAATFSQKANDLNDI